MHGRSTHTRVAIVGPFLVIFVAVIHGAEKTTARTALYEALRAQPGFPVQNDAPYLPSAALHYIYN